MSQQACADFFAAVSSDATLQQEVATALCQANLEALYGYKEDWEIYSMEGRALTELEELRRLEAVDIAIRFDSRTDLTKGWFVVKTSVLSSRF